jgi:hypothetical protein
VNDVKISRLLDFLPAKEKRIKKLIY